LLESVDEHPWVDSTVTWNEHDLYVSAGNYGCVHAITDHPRVDCVAGAPPRFRGRARRQRSPPRWWCSSAATKPCPIWCHGRRPSWALTDDSPIGSGCGTPMRPRWKSPATARLAGATLGADRPPPAANRRWPGPTRQSSNRWAVSH